jgi:hypothetical protein
MPLEVEKLLLVKLDDMQPLNGALEKVTTIIWNSMIVGLVFTVFMAAVFICSAFNRFFCLAGILLRVRILRVGIHVVFALICWVPFLVATVILYILRSKTGQLPSWIQVDQGEVSGLCLGSFCCAITMAVLNSIISVFF